MWGKELANISSKIQHTSLAGVALRVHFFARQKTKKKLLERRGVGNVVGEGFCANTIGCDKSASYEIITIT